ncbi:MAG: imidazolonepropionase [Bryobacteraceae bacterium]
MKKSLLVRGARQLITMNGPSGPRRGESLRNLGIIEDGAVLITGGVIASVGPTRRIENLAEARDADEISAAGRVVMPGFVDSHTHLIAGSARLEDHEMSIAGASEYEIERTGGGLFASIRKVRAASARSLEYQARRVIEGCIRHGTTTLEAKSGYGLDETTELRILRTIADLDQKPINVVPTYFGAHRTPPEYEQRTDEYLEWMCSHMIPKLRTRKLAKFADVFCDPRAFSPEFSRKYLQTAKRLGLIPKIHAHGVGVQIAVEVDAASADGLSDATEADANLLARSNTIATMMPGLDFDGRMDRFAPARTLIERGAAVALATGLQHVGSPTFNMQTVVALACKYMKMTTAEAISAATINGAHALRMADRVGSIQFGRDADLIVLNVSDYREISYYFGVNLVGLTMRRGQIIYKEADVLVPQTD